MHISKIGKSRQELTKLGIVLQRDVARVVGIINTARQYCQNDAVEIMMWLEDGENEADLPKYMAFDLGQANGICKYLFRGGLSTPRLKRLLIRKLF
jgi:hypothetical protein